MVMSEIIEGLPDVVAVRCLARVPFYLHPKLELVSLSWRAAVHSSEFFKARKEVLSSEEFLCVCAFDPNNGSNDDVDPLTGDPDGSFATDKNSSSAASIRKSSNRFGHITRRILEAFVPEGFPSGVTPDYVTFQIWDSLQVDGSYAYNLEKLVLKVCFVACATGEDQQNRCLRASDLQCLSALI